MLSFRQVDVFSTVPFGGNALAVVHAADGVSDEQMAVFARWTNLSETVFLQRPTNPTADYRVRIWTTGGELPFAGHPTLGSAHAWLEAGGVPRGGDHLVQECEAGLVRVRLGERLAFAAPPLVRTGPVDEALRQRVRVALGVDAEAILDMAWVDNGPGWIGVELDSADTVLAIEPSIADFADLKVAVLGRYAGTRCLGGRSVGAAQDGEAATEAPLVEVRAFYADGRDFGEDPVTGSANAGLAQWLVGSGRLPTAYLASQGTRLQRRGRIHLESRAGHLWVGGATMTRIVGEVDL